jgi:hypothetical protein
LLHFCQTVQRRADDHGRFRAELAALSRERTRLQTEPASLVEHQAYFARLSEFYDRLDTYFEQVDAPRPILSWRKRVSNDATGTVTTGRLPRRNWSPTWASVRAACRRNVVLQIVLSMVIRAHVPSAEAHSNSASDTV